MRFLQYHYSRTKLNYDTLHEMSIEELVKLRNSISFFHKISKDWHKHLSGPEYAKLVVIHPDFKSLYMNQHMIPEVLDKINGIIGKRNMKALQERKAKENKENEQQ